MMKLELFFILILAPWLSFSQATTEKKIVIQNEGWDIVGILNIPESEHKVPIVIMCHTMWGGNKSQYDEMAKVLMNRGIASLRIDLRGHGESINKGKLVKPDVDPAYVFDAWPDVVAAHKYVESLNTIDTDKIGVMAASYSGDLVAKAGRNYKFANSYVIFSSAMFSQESTVHIRYSNANWWHIVAKDDPTFAKYVVPFVEKRSPSRVTYYETGGHGPELLESHTELPFEIANWFIKSFYKNDYILKEKDLIPEGVAVDERTGTTYVGSTYKRKIVQIDQNGSISDFISQEENGIWSVLGMEVDEDEGILWANTADIHEVMPLINPSKGTQWKTSVSAFDIHQKKLLKKYELNDSTSAFNDLTVDDKGNVYTTESANNKIYIINKVAGRLELFLELKGFTFPNGITYFKDLNALFISTIEGILKVDIDSKDYFLLKERDSVDSKGIDGLALYGDYLIGHQSSKVSKFYFNNEYTELTRSEIIDSGKEFDSSTTGEIYGDNYIYLVNSQIRSGIDFKKKKVKPLESLNDVIIRKIPLSLNTN